jgi:hypothetical protein
LFWGIDMYELGFRVVEVVGGENAVHYVIRK